jgi:phosphatidylinositol dimannoside acyltransferase
MRIETLIESRTGLNLAAALARATPPWLGYLIAGLAARSISSRRDSDLVKAVRANQWVVSGGQLDKKSLDRVASAAFEHSARSIYDLYHYIHDPTSAGDLFVVHDSVQAILDRPEFDRRGLVVGGLHISSFDLALQWLCQQWVRPLVLTIPNPEGGRRLEFEMRRRTGMNLVPASVSGLRQAIRRLERGGIVATGIDRPQQDCDPGPCFFGRPACLPTHHVYLAIKARVPVTIVFARLEADGKYHLLASPSIEMDPYPERDKQLRCNAEKVLSMAERYIRQSPEQWSMSKPVWPEALNQASA